MATRDYVILTDSNCDLSDETCAQLGVRLVYMPYIIGEEDFSGAPDNRLDLNEFYNRMRDGQPTKTYQKSPEEYRLAYEAILAEEKDILVIAFSSQLSNTYNNSVLMARQMMEDHPEAHILVVDSQNATGGQALLVELAARKKAEGDTLEENARYLSQVRDQIGIYFFVDDLEYLYRGGRLSKAGAVVGTIIGVKPIIRVAKDGSLQTTDKVRGRKKAIAYLAEKTIQQLDSSLCSKIYLISAQSDEDALELGRMVLAQHPECDLELMPLGCCIGAHTGPGTLGIAFAAKEWF